MPAARMLAVACAALALAPGEAAAHAFAERYSLPLPLPLWLTAAGLAVALSFVVFAFALRRAAAGHPRVALLGLPAPVRAALRALGVLVFAVVVGAGLFGTQDPYRNFAPAFVWIAWWIGFTYLVVLAGDLWSLVNPWAALFPARTGARTLPRALGVWPAVALLLALAWIEIVWHDNAVPAAIAWLALGYSAITWTGMLVFGREPWLRAAEVFTVYFGFLARLAPAEFESGKWWLRPPAAGLLEPRALSASEAAFVIVMLSVVTFDGLRDTPLWAMPESAWTAATTAGLLLAPVALALAVAVTCAAMAPLTGARTGELMRLFVPTLLPIALAYHVAHYLPYLLLAGQLVIPLASDPLGRGWDLFGTAHYRVDAGLVGARFAWYTSVVVVVLGHVLAMYAAHRLALARFAERRTARLSQVPLAALMVAYTLLSLWILAQPVVESGG